MLPFSKRFSRKWNKAWKIKGAWRLLFLMFQILRMQLKISLLWWVSGVCCCGCLGCIVLQAAAAVSCVNSDVVIYWLVSGFNSDSKQSWGEPTDGPIYPMGNLVRGIYPATQQKNMWGCVFVCAGVCVYLCVFKPERGFNRHTDKVIHCSILVA